MTTGEPARRPKRGERRAAYGAAFRTVYGPEIAAIQQFDHLIAKLGELPGTKKTSTPGGPGGGATPPPGLPTT